LEYFKTGDNRCEKISPNAVYKKCTAGPPSACFKRTIAIKLGGFSGRCVCMEGYSMNLAEKCVKTTRKNCIKQMTVKSNKLFLPTTLEC
jgi:hypothetical protein